MDDRDLAPGTVLLDKYRVDENIGTGGMGRVVRASHLYLHQSVAFKILRPEMTASSSTVARFLREAQSAVRLKSEHTARVYDVGTFPDGTPFMIMEYLEGNDLNQILRHHGPQQPSIVCDLMLQACEGLAEAHAIGIIHRDIKPSNFFITRRPDGSMLLKILDFGISKTPVNYDDNLTSTQTVIGTPSYMSPEQMKSGKFADARSDVWSIGVVMFQLLQGRPPFASESYAELVLKVNSEQPTPFHVPLPAGLGEVILRCIEKQPHDRHQNVGELARSLAPYASDPVSAAHIATRTTRILQARGSNPSLQQLPTGAGGGLATPIPLSPAQLTPRSWPPSTSLSQGRGQQHTQRVSGSKGWMLAGAMSLTILAAAGGFIASTVMKDDVESREPAAATAPAKPEPVLTMPTAPTVPTVAPKPTVPVPTVPTVAKPTVPAKIDTAVEAKVETKPAKTEKRKPRTTATKPTTSATTKPTATKSTTKPTATKPTATTTATTKPAATKPAATKPATKPTTTTPTKSVDLFDSRH